MRFAMPLSSLGLALALTALAAPSVAQSFLIDGYDVETKAEAPQPFTDERYVDDFTHGTVLDTVTGLVWLGTGTCEDVPGVGASGAATWSDARRAVALLADGMCGLADGSQPGDWRLPTADEWSATIARAVAIGCTFAGAGNPPSLTNRPGTGCHDSGPPIFHSIQFLYWTSTLDDVNPDQAWFANIFSGTVESQAKVTKFSIWPVRDER